MHVIFCGPAFVSKPAKVEAWMQEVVVYLIEKGATVFFLSSYGEFDLIGGAAVHALQKKNSNLRTTIVLPYPRKRIATDEYGYVIYSSNSKSRRFAVPKRNLEMINDADVMVAYVVNNWDGAAKMLQHAQHKQKEIIRFPMLL